MQMRMGLKCVETDNYIEETFDWTKTIEVQNVKTGKREMVLVQEISIYDHRPIIFDKEYKIAGALSKESFQS